MKTRLMSVCAVILSLFSGCQCCPLFDRYANVVDDVNEHHIYFDRVYNPRCDLTRMGKPDWCSPLNNRFCKRCCDNGCYDRYDECHQYPPLYPFQFPSNVMPPPTVRTQRMQRRIDQEMMEELKHHAEQSDPVPAPAPAPANL
jgi:hypothetical protein